MIEAIEKQSLEKQSCLLSVVKRDVFSKSPDAQQEGLFALHSVPQIESRQGRPPHKGGYLQVFLVRRPPLTRLKEETQRRLGGFVRKRCGGLG